MLPTTDEHRRAAHSAVNVAFGSLGRVCLALDDRLHILDVAGALDGLLGPGAAAAWVGHPVEALLGPELIGPARPLRQALVAGERLEGWSAWLPVAPAGTRRCSGSAARLLREPGDGCPPGAAYVVVLCAADEAPLDDGTGPRSGAGAFARGPVPALQAGPPRPRGEPPPREALASALESNRWRMAQTAASLGISRTTLWRWMREAGLSR